MEGDWFLGKGEGNVGIASFSGESVHLLYLKSYQHQHRPRNALHL